jgi:hypothetical protein
MILRKKGFVDKGLYGLKGKLKTSNNPNEDQIIIEKEQTAPDQFFNAVHSENNVTLQDNINSSPDINQSNDINRKQNQDKVPHISSPVEQEQEKVTQTPSLINRKVTQKIKLDKEFTKALQKRKEEYFRTKKHVIDKADSTLNRIPILTLDLRRKLDEINKAEQSIKNALNEINEINEKSWTEDYSNELGIAAKTVENARLQHLMLTNKLTDLDNESNISSPAKGDNSIIPELTSLKFFQLCKMGLGFFLPLIIGLIITAAIISTTIFFVMGGF